MAIHRHQAGETLANIENTYKKDVLEGLQSSPKFLQSKYFYDEKGDQLFVDIMNSPEYYVTRCEMDIFRNKTAAIAAAITSNKEQAFDIIELGAGDATKSTHLLRYLAEQDFDYRYYPIDISKNVIQLLTNELPERIKGIDVHGLQGEYLPMITEAYQISDRPKVIFFLGSNIGNFQKKAARNFLEKVNEHMNEGDRFVMGVDLVKNPKQILAAYNDADGITKAFNLNLLERMNKELSANFDVDCFDHYPTYDPITGECRSYIISLQKQQVEIAGTCISFDENEPVYMELSQKYRVAEINQMATDAGFKTVAMLYDRNEWFVDAVWEKV